MLRLQTGLVVLLLFGLAPYKLHATDYNEQSIDNLKQFAKIYADTRFFYPEKKVSDDFWDYYLLEGIKYSNSHSKDEFYNGLGGFFQNMKLDIDVVESSCHFSVSDSVKTKAWEHWGCGPCSKEGYSWLYKIFNPYHSYWVKQQVSLYRSPCTKRDYLYTATYGPVTAAMPLRPKKGKHRVQEFVVEYPETSIANSIKVWATFYYFFPYEIRKGHTWDSLLDMALQDAINDTSQHDNDLTLMRWTHFVDDGHIAVLSKGYDYYYSVPLKLIELNNRIYVDRSCSDLDIVPGTEVLEIDDKPAINHFKYKSKFVSAATTATASTLTSWYLLDSTKHSLVELTFQNGDSIYSKQITRDSLYFPCRWMELPETGMIDSNTMYIDLSSLSAKSIKKMIDTLDVDNIILDLREYPRVGVGNYLPYFIDSSVSSSKWLVPITTQPKSTFEVKLHAVNDTSDWKIKPQKPYLGDKNIVVLIGEGTASAGETASSLFKYHRIGTLIGRTTAATNGNIAQISLLNGGRVRFTGMNVRNQDLSTYHGVGTKPDIEVAITPEDLRAGRDPDIERALQFFREGK